MCCAVLCVWCRITLPSGVHAAASAKGKPADWLYCSELLEQTGIVVVPGGWGVGTTPAGMLWRSGWQLGANRVSAPGIVQFADVLSRHFRMGGGMVHGEGGSGEPLSFIRPRPFSEDMVNSVTFRKHVAFWSVAADRLVKPLTTVVLCLNCVLVGSGFGQKPGTLHFRTTFLPPEEDMAEVAERLSAFHTAFLAKFGGL